MKRFTYLKKAIGTCILMGLVIACDKAPDLTFSVTNDRVGPVLKSTLISEIDSIFKTDSIVRLSPSNAIQKSSGKIEVFEKGGAHLLSITPTQDSLPKIENIRIHDPRYKTADGINVLSTFNDIRNKMAVKKVITSLNNVVILLKDSDLYFTISKDELPAELRFSTTDIDMVQIPDKAKIKYMMVGWN